MSFTEAGSILGIWKFGIKLGLDNMTNFLAFLVHPKQIYSLGGPIARLSIPYAG